MRKGKRKREGGSTSEKSGGVKLPIYNVNHDLLDSVSQCDGGKKKQKCK